MASNFIPLSIRIKEATKKLKDAGYSVVNNDDDNFAILAERKRFLCKNTTEFFKITTELTENVSSK